MDPVVKGNGMQEWMANSSRDWISPTGRKNEMEMLEIYSNRNEEYLGEFRSRLVVAKEIAISFEYFSIEVIRKQK